MTPAEHAKAIEDAAHRYARDFAVYCDGKEPVDLGVCNVSLAILQSAIIAGVGAAPEGWQLVQSTGSTQKCSCAACDKAANHGMRTHMSVCPRCGSKRCEKALNHQAECSSAPKP